MRRGWVGPVTVFVVGIAIVGALVTTAAAQSAVERIKKEGALKIAITPTAIGFNFKDPKTNELIGVNVEVGKRFAKELGVKPEFYEMAFPALFEYLLSKRADIVMSAVVIRPDRQAQFSFSDVNYSFGFSAIVKKEETRHFPDIAAVVAEFKKGNLRVGEQTNSAFVQTAKEAGIPTTAMLLYENKQDALRDVALGRIDITFWDTPIAQNYLFNNPDVAAKVKLVSEFSSGRPNDNGYPIRFEDKDLVAFVNKIMADMRRDGSWNQILMKFGMDPKLLLPTSLRK